MVVSSTKVTLRMKRASPLIESLSGYPLRYDLYWPRAVNVLCHRTLLVLLTTGVGTRLRHCATSRKVAGSILDGVIWIFHWRKPSGRTVALGLTQHLTEMSTRNISWWGKGDRYVGLTNLSASCADCLKIWKPQPPGNFIVYLGLFRDSFTFSFALAVP